MQLKVNICLVKTMVALVIGGYYVTIRAVGGRLLVHATDGKLEYSCLCAPNVRDGGDPRTLASLIQNNPPTVHETPVSVVLSFKMTRFTPRFDVVMRLLPLNTDTSSTTALLVAEIGYLESELATLKPAQSDDFAVPRGVSGRRRAERAPTFAMFEAANSSTAPSPAFTFTPSEQASPSRALSPGPYSSLSHAWMG